MLTDIRMPPTYTTEGIDAAKRIRADYPDIGVVVLSQYAEDDYAFELLENGVGGLGYLLKERVAERDELVRALQEVARGGSALDSEGDRGVARSQVARATSPLLGLTDREREVLQEMATGRNNAHHRQDPVHERPGGGEAHRLDLSEAGSGRGGGAVIAG